VRNDGNRRTVRNCGELAAELRRELVQKPERRNRNAPQMRNCERKRAKRNATARKSGGNVRRNVNQGGIMVESGESGT
jgi:hypothetical protein